METLAVDEGDYVQKGQVVATLDTASLNAQLAEARADSHEADNAVITSETTVAERLADLDAAKAVLVQRQAELNVDVKHADRSAILSHEGATPVQDHDNDVARVESARATVASARAQIAASEAAVATARTEVIGAHAHADAEKATIARIESDLADTELLAPVFGRVQYRILQRGEVAAAGGKVVNMIDLSDVYMTFFVPETLAGRIGIGQEARIVLDAVPQYVIPATVSFVADVAQFTPKTVETAVERQKLMFRVKARIAPELLREHVRQIKTGLPGVTYVKLDSRPQWPENLRAGEHRAR